MAHELNCSECGKRLRVAAENLGKTIRCPYCKATFGAKAPAEQPMPDLTIGPPQTPPTPAPAAIEITTLPSVIPVAPRRSDPDVNKPIPVLAVAEQPDMPSGRRTPKKQTEFRRLRWPALLPIGMPLLAILIAFLMRVPNWTSGSAALWIGGWSIAGLLTAAACFGLGRLRWPMVLRVLGGLFLIGFAYFGAAAAMMVAFILWGQGIADSEWIDFQPEGDKYSVKFPGRPQLTDADRDFRGFQFTEYTMQRGLPALTYHFEKVENPVEWRGGLPHNAKFRLQDAIDSTLDRIGGRRIHKSRDFVFDGEYPARELLFETRNGMAKARFYCIHRRVYRVMVHGPSLRIDTPDAATFLDSFRWLVVPRSVPDPMEFPGLIAAWRFNEGKGDVAKNAVKNGPAARLNGATWIKGVHGKGVSLAADQMVDYGSNNAISFKERQPFTFAGWFRCQENQGKLLAHGDTGRGKSSLLVNIHRGVVFAAMTGQNETGIHNNVTIRGMDVDDGEWRHFAVTRNGGSTIELYVDGKRFRSASGFGARFAIDGSVHRLGDGAHIDFDEFCIFNRRLTQVEIARLASLKKSPDEMRDPLKPGTLLFPAQQHLAAMAFSKDIPVVLTMTDPNRDPEVHVHIGSPLEHDFSFRGYTPIRLWPDGKKVLYGHPDKEHMQVFDLVKGETLPQTFPKFAKGYRSAVAISPDGKSILVSRGPEIPRGVFRHDAATGLLTAHWKHLDFEPYLIVYHPDGKTFACSNRNRLVLCNSSNGKILVDRPIGGSMMFSPDGKYALMRVNPGVRLVDATTGADVRAIPALGENTLTLAFSPSGKYVVGGGYRRAPDIQLVETATGVVRSKVRMNDAPLSLRFLPNGNLLVGNEVKDTQRLFNLSAAEMTALAKKPKLPNRSIGTGKTPKAPPTAGVGPEITVKTPANIENLALAAAGRLLAVNCSDKRLHFWDTNSGKNLDQTINRRGEMGLFDELQISTDGKWIATADRRGVVSILSAANWAKLHEIDLSRKGKLWRMTFSHNSKKLAVLSETQFLTVDLPAFEMQEHQVGFRLFPTGIASVPGNKYLLAADYQRHARGMCHLFDAQTGKKMQSYKIFPGYGSAFGFSGELRISCNCRFVAQTNMQKKQVMIWDMQQKKALPPLKAPFADHDLHDFIWLPDHRTLAVWWKNYAVSFWDVGSNKEIAKLVLHGNPHRRFAGLAASPDGARIAVARADEVAIFDVAKILKRKLQVALLPSEPPFSLGLPKPPANVAITAPAEVRQMVFSANGHTLAGWCQDGFVRWWDLPTKKLMAEHRDIEAERRLSNQVLYSPNREWIATLNRKGDVALYDATRGKKQKVIPYQQGGDHFFAAFSGDGKSLVVLTTNSFQVVDLHNFNVKWHASPTLSSNKGVFAVPGHRQFYVLSRAGYKKLACHIIDAKVGKVTASIPLFTKSKLRSTGHVGRYVSADGRYLAITDILKEIRVWDFKQGKALPIISTDQRIFRLDWARDCRTLMIWCSGPSIRFYDVVANKEIGRISLKNDDRRISGLAVSPNGDQLAVAKQNFIVIHDLVKVLKRKLPVVPLPWQLPFKIKTSAANPAPSPKLKLDGKLALRKFAEIRYGPKRLNGIISTRLSPDGKKFLLSSKDWFCCYNVQTGKRLWEKNLDLPGYVKSHRILPDAKRMAICMISPSRLVLVNLADGQLQETVALPAKAQFTMACSPDSKTLLVETNNGLLLADLTSRTVRKTPFRFAPAAARAFFDADGKSVFLAAMTSANRPGITAHFDLATGKQLAPLPERVRGYQLVGWSEDRTTLLFCDKDKRLSVFNRAANRVVASCPQSLFRMPYRLSPDGRFLFAFSREGKLVKWDCTTNRFYASEPVLARYNVPRFAASSGIVGIWRGADVSLKLFRVEMAVED